MLLSETKFIFRGIAAALTVILVLPAALFVWMLMAGGVSLGFLSPYLQEALTLRDSPYRVEFDDTILAWNRDDYALDIRAIDLRLVDKGDTVLAILPEVGVSLSLDAMLQGIVAPTRVALRGLHLDLKRDETGGIALAAAKDSVPGAGTGAGALGSWLGELLKEPDPARPTGRLSTVALRGGALSLDDQASGHVWRATNTDIVLNRDAAGIAGTARLVLGLDGAEVPMSADIAYRGTDGTTGLRVGFSALEPGRLAARLPALAGAEAVEMAFSGELRFDLDRDFRPGPIAFAIRGAPGRLVLPAHFTDAVPLRSSEFRGRLARTLDRVEIDEARIETHGPVLTGAGSITSTPRGLALRLRAAANEVRLNDLGRYWPKSFAVNARRWVTTNIRDGQATDGKFTLRLDPGDLAKPRLAKDALEFTFNFSGVSADYFNPMPRIRQARGQARIDAAAFELTLADGTVDALAVSQGRLVIEDLNDPQPLFRSSFSVEGPAARALWLADHEPLALVAEMGFDPAKVAGRSMTRIELRFPISERLTAKQVDVRARARLTGAGIPKLIDDHDLRDGDLQMDVDPRRLEMTGTAVLAEIPLTFRWDETFNPPDGITSRYRVNARPALSRIAALGLPIGDKAKGSVAVDLAVATKGEHLHEAKATVDLTEAEFDLPLPHWRKKAKVPAKATIDAAFPPDAIELRAFGLEGEGMRLGGSASFSRDYAPRRVTITELRQGETEVSGRAEWLADGGLRLALSGKTLDLRPYLRD
ncbi:MAG: hypothetical protein FJX47_06925, partial [Alphaproteobacteria bacterium]|nr:hypothetical protein [Alphaproteobacteria bacterium]